MGTDMQKRKDRRFKQWNKTRIIPLSESGAPKPRQASDAFTYDLSIGGARIHSERSFEVGTLFRLQIDLVRTGETLRVEGLVKWRRLEENANVYEMGIEFQHANMASVLILMRDLHDGRRPPVADGGPPAELSRS